MPRSSIEKRRGIRKLEAKRDELMMKAKVGKSALASVRAALKTARRQGV